MRRIYLYPFHYDRVFFVKPLAEIGWDGASYSKCITVQAGLCSGGIHVRGGCHMCIN